MDFNEVIDKRYSCRSFSDKKPEKEKLDRIIKTALKAPTAVNLQPFKVFLAESDAAKQAVRSSTKYTFGADTFIVVGYKENDAWVRSYDGRNFADVDASIVAAYIMLLIENEGLSTTWVGSFDAPCLKKAVPALKDWELIAIFPVGYAAADAEPSPRHSVRKPVNEVFEIL